MERVVQVLAGLDGVATSEQLRRAGVTPRQLRAAVERGAVLRLRRGWYAVPAVPSAQRRAVAAGGVLTCASALSSRGLWVLESEQLHVAVPPHASERRGGNGVLLHRRRWEGCGHETSSLDGLRSSLLHLLACVDGEDALMTFDSAVNSGAVDLDDLLGLRALAPAGKRWVFDEIEPRAQSGLETRVRRCGRRLRVRVRSQVDVPRVGRVDVVLGDRLVLEPDGRAFHSGSHQLEEDYRRSLELAAQGYLCLRLSTRQIVGSWDRTEAVIRGLVRRREHLWSALRPADRP
ncbi:hypothetical protein C5D34_00350 [Rathayibacter sp. AY1B1]|uniref:type IV toxin-antitoxin system AbiEi family antitoxin domain-containing protein n=1 Tax=unclassified Rathayibacter TaxID=2609250 RepID=UPI000CE7619E|nr:MULTISPECIES: type IV toxin-antitoxin system AbiEi family antitoxin domain-containing protein [unclassified Rathayibacter]PPI20254.1 hypothetical protein C5D08_11990 [Rathayibacter sp. AY1B6]PPI39672.1 hypothetical protein C5D34_00350 [Rathayibacter sp. AY1B1]